MDIISLGQLTGLLASYGYLAVFLLVAIESTGVPVPGETMLIAAAVYAGSTHHLNLVGVILAAAGGAIAGDNLGYLAGRIGGYRLLHRFGTYVRVDAQKLKVGEYLFARHGGKTVFFGRFVAILRMWAAFLAGTYRMPWARFTVANAAGGLAWATLYGIGGYGFGQQLLAHGTVIGIASLVLGLGLMVALTLAARRAEARLSRAVDRDLGVWQRPASVPSASAAVIERSAA